MTALRPDIVLSQLLAFSLAVAPALADEPQVDFNRDVRPLLASRCFACHGPDEEAREADLRLDQRENAISAGVIVPGEPDDSELIARITETDESIRMPPAEAGKPLAEQEQTLLRNWIAAGAEYDTHWAFVPPKRPEVPAVKRVDWPSNPIDRFVLARLEQAGMTPSPEADVYSLIRRVYLDLIGLPPTPEEADLWATRLAQREREYANDRSSQVNEAVWRQLVDSLLASPRYGEYWARRWLDLARYADTNGYEKDRPRSIWPYRDWVIRALNNDMPYDRFTVEQLAGDMLPNADESQRIATGFHRNTMLNEEGGIDPLEFRFYAMVDRVATTGTVWLGLTTGCAQCHTHKYDPISHTDYYRLFALLNNADEPDLNVSHQQTLAKRERIQEQIDELIARLPEQFPPDDGPGTVAERRERHLKESFAEWLDTTRSQLADWTVLRASDLDSNLPKLESLDDASILSSGDITKRDVFTITLPLDDLERPITAIRLEALPDERLPAGGPGRAYYEGRKGDFFLSEVTARVLGEPVRFDDASHSYGKISVGSGSAEAVNVIDGDGSTGWSTSGREGERHELVLRLSEPVAPKGELEITLLFERHFAASLGRFRFSATSDPEATAVDLSHEIRELLRSEHAGSTNDPQSAADPSLALRAYFLETSPLLAEARKPIETLREQMPSMPHTLVLEERPADNPRPTYRHHRGEYLSPREEVPPGVPAVFVPDDSGHEQPSDRLELARWLVSDENPLAARVTVNRSWRAFFGKGLVRTDGDYGTQSEPPTHPELLNWLAVELVRQGWSLKELHRQIVCSATYRQSSNVREPLQQRDPGNRLLARQNRHRVTAEAVRDIMLSSSDRLSGKMYGQSVMPPQPASVTALAYGNSDWTPATGEDRYRRSLYTFSKRTAPFAASSVFDGPSGETCLARRNVSNTPLQALTLLNDEMFLELARATARRVVQDDAPPRGNAEAIFRRFLTRPPEAEELDAIVAYYHGQQKRLENGSLDAAAILGTDSGEPSAVDSATAGWVLVARALMNLDETITRP